MPLLRRRCLHLAAGRNGQMAAEVANIKPEQAADVDAAPPVNR
jgi:hypothetical protein